MILNLEHCVKMIKRNMLHYANSAADNKYNSKLRAGAFLSLFFSLESVGPFIGVQQGSKNKCKR